MGLGWACALTSSCLVISATYKWATLGTRGIICKNTTKIYAISATSHAFVWLIKVSTQHQFVNVQTYNQYH